MASSLQTVAHLTSRRRKIQLSFRGIRIVLILIILLSFPIRAGADSQTDFATQMETQMPALLAKYNVPGAVAAYIQNGEVAWTHAYGVANLKTGASMQPEMIFNFGSCGKVLTAWGVMRLVEQGKVDLDTPVNQYLKRWKLTSAEFDPQGVTLRRLLSHTAGLTVAGFSDYGSRRSLPSLVQMLEGQNQMGGRVEIQWQPGSTFAYSGGGYTVIQMVIEDVSGEPFETFMQQQVSEPLGLSSLQWTWTPELENAAATPYGTQSEPVGYRQLASQAIGSEIGTAADFARFVAAAVQGPNGEPAGRDVLTPESIHQMVQIQANTEGTEGLGYGIGMIGGNKQLMHFGSNPGWNAFFMLDQGRREGLVFATNSSNGFPLATAVEDIWSRAVLGQTTHVLPPETDRLGTAGRLALGIAGVFGLPLLISLAVFLVQLKRNRRRYAVRNPLRWLLVLPWVLLAFFWWYWIYAPFHIILPASFPDAWPLPQTAIALGVVMAWIVFSLVTVVFPKTRRIIPMPNLQKESGRL